MSELRTARIEKAAKYLKGRYSKKVLGGNDQKRSDAVIKYIGGSSRDINQRLWQDRSTRKDFASKYNRNALKATLTHIVPLRRAISSKKLTKAMVVYHGWKGNHEDIQTGKTIKLRGFTSTSIDPKVASEFAEPHRESDGSKFVFNFKTGTKHKDVVAHILRIKVPKGSTHGAYISHMSSDKDWQNEKEFLLKPKRTIKIVGNPKKITDKHGSRFNIWRAELQEALNIYKRRK